jgi:excisionase family DNA binding protein
MKNQLLGPAVPDVLTPMEAARILHIGRSTMYQLLAQGEIRSFKIKTKILIPKTFLQDFIAKYAEISYHGDIQMAENLSCCEKGEEV